MEEKIIRAIVRSETAYQFYKIEKAYYQSKRIYTANLSIYNLLIEYSYVCDEDLITETLNYIFHLEDWFLQYKELEKSVTQLQQEFIFERFKNSPSFPKHFKSKLKEKL
jgi:muramoyltetrapeptide carboxypeptidase LdcA involved in peptidoglycan recycling